VNQAVTLKRKSAANAGTRSLYTGRLEPASGTGAILSDARAAELRTTRQMLLSACFVEQGTLG